MDENTLHIEPDSNIVIIGGKRFQLEPRVMAVLKMLIEAEGKVVRREVFLDHIWNNRSGSDEALTQSISRLRKILDDAKGVSINTHSKVGYQLVFGKVPGPTVNIVERVPKTKLHPDEVGFFRRNEKYFLAFFALLILAVLVFLMLPKEIELEEVLITPAQEG